MKIMLTDTKNSLEPNPSVPHQLREVDKLFDLINCRLQDCALEWQAKVSSKQWKISDMDNTSGKTLDKSLLARTFFTEKLLDEEFQVLLSCGGTFAQLLKNFIDLLQNPANSETTRICGDSKLKTDWINVHLQKNSNDMKNSLANLFEAKNNFDVKFVNFENFVNRHNTSYLCVCHTCANVEKYQHCPKKSNTSPREQNKLRNRKTKRLKRSTRTLTNMRNKSKSINVGTN